MNIQDINKLRDLLVETCKSTAFGEEFLTDINDVCDEFFGLEDEQKDFGLSLIYLGQALGNADRKGIAEAMSAARIICMNIDSTYSALSDLMSKMIVAVMDEVRLKAAKSHEGLEIKDLLFKNNQVELGTFMDELSNRQNFNESKFQHLSELLSAYNGSDPEVFSAAFRLYSWVSKMLFSHGDPNDGFVIRNIEPDNFSVLREAVEKFESLVISLFHKVCRQRGGA